MANVVGNRVPGVARGLQKVAGGNGANSVVDDGELNGEESVVQAQATEEPVVTAVEEAAARKAALAAEEKITARTMPVVKETKKSEARAVKKQNTLRVTKKKTMILKRKTKINPLMERKNLRRKRR